MVIHKFCSFWENQQFVTSFTSCKSRASSKYKSNRNSRTGWISIMSCTTTLFISWSVKTCPTRMLRRRRFWCCRATIRARIIRSCRIIFTQDITILNRSMRWFDKCGSVRFTMVVSANQGFLQNPSSIRFVPIKCVSATFDPVGLFNARC